MYAWSLVKINPVNLDFIYFKSKLGDWIFTIQLATRLTFSAMFELPKKTLSCDKMGVEIGLVWGIWQGSGENKLVNGGSIIIHLTLSQNDYGRL